MADLDLPDVNVLVALLHPTHVHHRPAQNWFDSVDRFATTPVTESGFVRTALNPMISGTPLTLAAVMASLNSLRGDDRAEFVSDDSSLTHPHIDLRGLVGFRQVTDFQLVNLAARHSARLVTFDRKMDRVVLPEDRRWLHILN